MWRLDCTASSYCFAHDSPCQACLPHLRDCLSCTLSSRRCCCMWHAHLLISFSLSLSLSFSTRFACEDLNADAAKSIRPTNKREEAQQLFAICRLTGSNEKILEEREISLELLIKLFLILKILNFSIKPFHKTLFYAYIDLTIGLYLSFYKISQENSTCCSLT